jgi:putative ABC transport system permease protein
MGLRMFSVYTTLSLRHLRRHWVRAVLIVLSIAAGVSLLVATRALNQTMDRAAATAATPLSGIADLIVSNGDAPVDGGIAIELLRIPGVAAARRRIFTRVLLPDQQGRTALLVAIDPAAERRDKSAASWHVEYDEHPAAVAWAQFTARKVPVVVGKSLDDALGPTPRDLRVQIPASKAVYVMRRAGVISGEGPAAALGGNILVMRLTEQTPRILGLKKPWHVSRIDLTLARGADRAAVQQRVAAVLAGRGEVRTPEEQNQTVQNVMSSLQASLLLCGVAALVVGLFLVYNALSVSVTERRHEIGVLRGLGATRGQVIRLFTGEAALLGLAGSLLAIPLGLLSARLGLEPMRGVLSNLFFAMENTPVEVGAELIAAAVAAGVATAVAAALVPALAAACEKPAEAVRRIPPVARWRHRFVQVAASVALVTGGAACIVWRDWLPPRAGMYGGLALVVLGVLLATPLLTAALAGVLLPLARRCLGIEGRLAADNLVRAPGRTGLVIAALAAGVGLVTETTGVLDSIRTDLDDWVRQAVAADLLVTAGSPVSAGGQSQPMDEALGARLRKTAGAAAVLPVRMRRQFFRDTQILMIAVHPAEVVAALDRRGASDVSPSAACYRALSERADGAIISENFGRLYGVGVGDTVSVASPNGPVELHVVGRLADYSWNHGSIVVNRALYLQRWEDARVDLYEVYLPPGSDGRAAQEALLQEHGAEHGLFVLRQGEVQGRINATIEELYAIALAQLVVVMFVAALGVVTALSISVLQRRRELGLLRAAGASRGQVLRSVLAEALLMGALGTLIGLLIGVPLQWYALRVVMLEETGYAFPVRVPWAASLWIALASLATAALAGLGPALYAIRQRIPEAIANE